MWIIHLVLYRIMLSLKYSASIMNPTLLLNITGEVVSPVFQTAKAELVIATTCHMVTSGNSLNRYPAFRTPLEIPKVLEEVGVALSSMLLHHAVPTELALTLPTLRRIQSQVHNAFFTVWSWTQFHVGVRHRLTPEFVFPELVLHFLRQQSVDGRLEYQFFRTVFLRTENGFVYVDLVDGIFDETGFAELVVAEVETGDVGVEELVFADVADVGSQNVLSDLGFGVERLMVAEVLSKSLG